ncbi:MAG: ATP-binding cassette domain-containing protein, partial [Nanoarchaeota archaeon]
MNDLIVKDLHVKVEDKEIVKGLNLNVKKGEIVALMGPNGSGKSTIANVIMGNPKYNITNGEIYYKGKNILELKPYDRAKLGLFL